MCPGLMRKGREEVGTVRHGFNNALRIDSDNFVVQNKSLLDKHHKHKC